jgi:hypothetical protein
MHGVAFHSPKIIFSGSRRAVDACTQGFASIGAELGPICATTIGVASGLGVLELLDTFLVSMRATTIKTGGDPRGVSLGVEDGFSTGIGGTCPEAFGGEIAILGFGK